jgi:hypothetical protein
MQCGSNVPTWQKNLLPLKVFSSTLMMEVACSSEASVHICEVIRCHITDDSSLNCVHVSSFMWDGMYVSIYAEQLGANGDDYDM